MENAPDTAVIFGSPYTYVATDVVTYAPGWWDMASLVVARRLVRLGWFAKNATGGGTTLNHVRVAATFEVLRICS